MFLQKQSLSKKSRGLCAICVTATSLPGSSNKFVKGLQTFSWWKKWHVQYLHCWPEGMCHIHHVLLRQSYGWKSHFFIIWEVGEREGESWAQRCCPNEKVQVIKMLSYQKSQSRRKWAGCSTRSWRWGLCVSPNFDMEYKKSTLRISWRNSSDLSRIIVERNLSQECVRKLSNYI